LEGLPLPVNVDVTVPVPVDFDDSGTGQDVRYLRLSFPRGTFEQDATLNEIQFGYEWGPWDDTDDVPMGTTHSPVADAGDDIFAELTGRNLVMVVLDGSASTDADSTPGTNDDIVSFDWYVEGAHIGSGDILHHTFPLGTNNVSLIVKDKQGHGDEDIVIVTVSSDPNIPLAGLGGGDVNSALPE
jgi:hypothetical protein